MKVKIVAIRTAGMGCIKDDVHIYEDVEKIVDTGTCFEIFFNSDRGDERIRSILCKKENWELHLQ